MNLLILPIISIVYAEPYMPVTCNTYKTEDDCTTFCACNWCNSTCFYRSDFECTPKSPFCEEEVTALQYVLGISLAILGCICISTVLYGFYKSIQNCCTKRDDYIMMT